MAAALDETKADFSGSYALRITDNLDEFLEKVEKEGFLKRKAMALMTPTIVVTHDPEKGTFKTVITVPVKGEMTLDVPLDGSEVTYERFDGATTKATFTVSEDGQQIVETQTDRSDGDELVVTRYFEEGEFCIKMHHVTLDITAIRRFKKAE